MIDCISQEKLLCEDRARDLFKQVVDTVVKCYERGVVQRDINDENLIVDMDSGKLELIDLTYPIISEKQYIDTQTMAKPDTKNILLDTLQNI